MAIVKTKDGKFFDIDDNVLEGKEVKPPEGVSPQGGPGPGGHGGPGMGAGGPVQIIVNLPSPGGPPPGAKPASCEEGAEAEELQDVAGHWRHYYGGGGWGGGGWAGWGNFWRNCWRNFGGPPGW